MYTITSYHFNYYPFGMLMPGRQYSTSDGDYRFGFQSQEEDSETQWVNYKFRQYDARLGKFFVIDPLAGKFAWNSPYAFSENRVIDAIEVEGLYVVLIGVDNTVSFGLSGSAGAGFAIASDGVYAYGGYAIGADLNGAVSSCMSFTWYPTMPSAYNIEGGGMMLGVSGGTPAGFAGALNFVATEDGYYGGNLQIGVGASALPVSASGYYTYTDAISPVSGLAQTTAAINLMKKALPFLEANAKSLEEEYIALQEQGGLLIQNMWDATDPDEKKMWEDKVQKNEETSKEKWDEMNSAYEAVGIVTKNIKKLEASLENQNETTDGGGGW